ncbi:MAG: glycosyltransferase family 2 protein [Tannerella sp.]|jgi:dolichol-phosphate mannosyltransferase|nr:glycosyltransferase family 2 protein [Tannerella sp.]
MEKLSVIIPCYDEEASLSASYRRTREVLNRVAYDTEIIYVNDGSRDRTGKMLDDIAAADARVKVIHFSRNFGHQPAVSAGIQHCDADWAIIMDADLQDPPELIPDILQRCKDEQANSVYCVRRSREDEGWFKRLSAKFFYRTLNRMTSEVKFPLDTGDFRLIDRKIMTEFKRLHERGKYIRGLVSWIGFRQVPFFYERKARVAGETKYPFRKMLRFASTALLYFSKKPLRMVIGLGFFAVLVATGLALWFTLGKIYGFSKAETGWTSLITVITFFGGVQLLTVGVLGEYIGVLFDEIKKRPEYIIDEKRNFSGNKSDTASPLV